MELNDFLDLLQYKTDVNIFKTDETQKDYTCTGISDSDEYYIRKIKGEVIWFDFDDRNNVLEIGIIKEESK